jgi:hypothetical protein
MAVSGAMNLRTWLLLISLVGVGCGASTGTGAQGPPAVIRSFAADPTSLPADGGTVTLSWDVVDATSLTLEPGVGAVTPLTTGSLQLGVTSTTTFTLTAARTGGPTTFGIQTVRVATVCDPSGSLAGTCNLFQQGRCLEYSMVSTSDMDSLPDVCAFYDGVWSTTALCATDSRVGTCDIPPADSGSGLECSPAATVLERFYAPAFSQSTAQAVCGSLPGATFTGG